MNGIAEPGADLLQSSGDVDLQVARLDDAGAGDQEQRLVEAGFKPAQLHAATTAQGAAVRARPGDARAPPARRP